MNGLTDYVKDTLGVKIENKPLITADINKLPLFITLEYNLEHTKLFNHDIILAYVKNNFTSEKLRKHIDIIKATYNIITVVVIKELEAYNRARLIEKKIPFIIPGKQMYLPDLLIDLKEFGTKPKEQIKTLQPAAQMLLLYHLQVESLEGINLKGIAEKLDYNAMTITRAVHYLHNFGFCKLQGTKDKFLHFEMNRKDLWKESESSMSNPIKKTTYYSGWIQDENLRKSNINALAFYTNLNDEAIEYYAVKPGYTQLIKSVNLKETAQNDGNICIEEWKYDPYRLTKTENVDPLSLYLCFRNNLDERISMATEQLIDEFKW